MGLIDKVNGSHTQQQEPQQPDGIVFDKEECELILSLISSSTFQGKNVALVYDTALKVQTYYEGLMKRVNATTTDK